MLTIIGRRWFEKTNGNTYHSVEVYDSEGKLLVRVPFTYGYGDHYRQTALAECIKLGLYSGEEEKNGSPKAWRSFMFGKDSGGDGNLFSVTDVQRKKDL
jgi:hypothetical protein